MTNQTLPSGNTLSPEIVRRDWMKALLDVPPSIGGGQMYVIVPRTWTLFPIPEAFRSPRPGDAARLVAQLNGPETAGFSPFLQIQCARLERDISAFDWLRFFCRQMRFSVRNIDEISDAIADALVGFEIANDVVAARVVVRMYGDLALIVLAGDAAGRYDAVSEDLGFMVRGFVLENRQPGGDIETLAIVSATHGPRFSIPQSWKVDPVPAPKASFGAYDLTNFGPDNAWLGQMRVRWLDQTVRSSDADEARMMMTELSQGGLQAGATLFSAVNAQPGRGYAATATMIRAAELKGNPAPLELFQVLLKGTKGRVFLVMLTPARDRSFYWWAVNRRALDIVVGTLE